VFVSWRAPVPVWIQTLPAFAYRIEPSKIVSGGVTTTPDGAGVALTPSSGPAPFPSPPPPGFDVVRNGIWPWSRLSVTIATTTRPTTARNGAT